MCETIRTVKRTTIMKTYKTYQARNAVKAAQVTNHIKAAKKNGVSHLEAKAEAYRIYSIKAAVPSICLLYTSPSPRDVEESRMPSSA